MLAIFNILRSTLLTRLDAFAFENTIIILRLIKKISLIVL